MSIKIDDVRAYVATVRYQSLTRAAEALGLPQSAVTRRIQSLEVELKASLLDRDTRPPKPTPLGWRVFEKCQTLLRDTDELKSLVSVDENPQGTIRLGIPQTIAEIGLFHILDELQGLYPELDIQVMTRWSPELLGMVSSGELHAATVIYPPSQIFPELIRAKHLMPLEMVVVCREGAWPIRKEPYSLLDLSGYGWVLNPEGCGFRARLQQAMLDLGRPLNVVTDTFGTEIQLKLVSETIGLGLVPMPFLDASRYRNVLDVVSLSDFKPTVDLWLIHGTAPGNLTNAIDTFGASVVNSMSGVITAADHQLPTKTG